MRPLRSAVAVIFAIVVAACTGGGPQSGSPAGDQKSLVVTSSDFPESKILAEIYGQALETNGFTITRRHGMGSRETYMPAMLDHKVDLVADYMGNLLHYFDPQTTATTLEAIQQDLQRVLPPQLSTLTPSSAVDTDTFTVTADTAKKWNLRTIADLAPYQDQLTYAAPPEFQTRPHGLPGLKAKYGIEIKPENFVGISDGGGPATVRALVEGKVLAADIFSTVPAIPQNDLVVLKDPNHLFLANNVVPLVNSQKKSEGLQTVLNAVSKKLTTAELVGLNTAIAGNAGVRPEEAARKWLKDNGFDKPML